MDVLAQLSGVIIRQGKLNEGMVLREGLTMATSSTQLTNSEQGVMRQMMKDAQLLDQARVLQVRASNLAVSQKWAEAESVAREALDALRAMDAPDFDLRSKMLTQISGYLGKLAKWKEAVSFCRESVELSKAHHEITQTPMEALMFWSSYGISLCKAKEYIEGIDAVRAAVQLAVARLEMVGHARNLRVVAWGCLQDISPVVPHLTLLSYEQSAPVVFGDAMQIFDRAIALW